MQIKKRRIKIKKHGQHGEQVTNLFSMFRHFSQAGSLPPVS